MIIVAELSLYPLTTEPVPEIVRFIKQLQQRPGLQVHVNQLSTQLCGEFDVVTGAVNECLQIAMNADHTVSLVAKYLNIDVDLEQEPVLG